MKRRIAIVGAGSAGLLTAAHFSTWLDRSWQVVLIHDPKKEILTIGESTNGAFINVLERGTNFSLAREEDLKALDATLKFGSKFRGWRQHTWINPLLSGNIAIHFNNKRFKDFMVERLSRLWGEQFQVLETNVREVQNFSDKVRLVTNEGPEDFHFVVDCTGMPSDYTGYTLSDCTLIDRCWIHTVSEYEYEPFTDHIATKNGWMFGVPLRGHKTYGYLYNQGMTSDEEAAQDMKQALGISQLEPGAYDAQYSFRCYHANELISGRVAKNGNRALFFEPLLANSIFVYIYAARLIYDHFVAGQDVTRCNAHFCKAVREMEDVISYYYKGGSSYDSEFWRAASASAAARLQQRTEFWEYAAILRNLKSQGTMFSGAPYAFSPHTWHLVDEQMGYGTFGP
jgi:hypothetical protein